jgi:hypothetical protein
VTELVCTSILTPSHVDHNIREYKVILAIILKKHVFYILFLVGKNVLYEKQSRNIINEMLSKQDKLLMVLPRLMKKVIGK